MVAIRAKTVARVSFLTASAVVVLVVVAGVSVRRAVSMVAVVLEL